MKTLVVGGTFHNTMGKESSIARMISMYLKADCLNGGQVRGAHLHDFSLKGYDLTVWMPNILGDVEKKYPKKDIGSVLICSKVMRPGYTSVDSISRIFKMGGNAVIEVFTETPRIRFRLVDALGNMWCDTDDTKELAISIKELYDWTKGSIRVRTYPRIPKGGHQPAPNTDMDHLCDIVHQVADKVHNQVNERYFGNVSTRCMSMFPSRRNTLGGIFVSPRNLNKKEIKPNDFVYVYREGNICYDPRKDNKPSVDAAVQLALYEKFPDISYMIHGHAHVIGAPTTEHYYPCGDLREVGAVEDMVKSGDLDPERAVLNLKQHGFVFMTKTLKSMIELTVRAKYELQCNKSYSE